MKSLITLKILEYIETKSGKKITELFDVVDGTSSGGVLALYLTVPDVANPKTSKYKASDIINIFEKDTRKIFKPRSVLIPTTLIQAVRPGYSSKNLEDTFEERFKDTKLSDLVSKTVILCFNPETINAFLLKSYDKTTSDTLVKDAELQQFQFPFIFPPCITITRIFRRLKLLLTGEQSQKTPPLSHILSLKSYTRIPE